MKKIFTTVFALAALLSANAQMATGVQARVYAYDLQLSAADATVEGGTIKEYTLTFKTNTAAVIDSENKATVVLTSTDDPSITYEVEATQTGTDGKSWTATVSADAVENIVAGTYTWSAKVSAPAVTSAGLSLVSDNANSDKFSFFRPTSVAVDNSTESDYFGRVYVVNTKGDETVENTKNRTAVTGLYAYSPELIAESDGSPLLAGYGNDGDDVEGVIGYGWNNSDITKGEYKVSRSTPRDMAVGGDGRIYLGIFAHSVSGVMVINPADMSRTMMASGGTRNATTGYYVVNDVNVVGRVSGIGVRGGSEDTQVYVTDYSNTFKSDGTEKANPLAVSRYDLGTSNTWVSAPSWKQSNFTNENKVSTSSNSATSVIFGEFTSIDPVTNGFWAATQVFTDITTKDHRYTPLFYYSEKTGKVEWEIMYQLPDLTHTNSTYYALGALAVNEELGLVAYSEYNSTDQIGTARILKYSENEDGTLNVEYVGEYALTGQGKHHTSFDFDYAGNLYAVTNNVERLSVFTLADDIAGENTRTTPAKSSQIVEITAADIATGIEEIGTDNAAPVEYYNLQGVKVENPSNGVFIRKQGAKTTKVIL